MHITRCGSGDPILFIHGMPTSSRLWKGIIERLCGHYTCFAVDLPGLGDSPSQPYNPDFLLRITKQIDEIRIANNIDRWHVVGHDAGAVVAVHYARYFQPHVACMALLSPALFPELKPFYILEALRIPILGEMLAPLIGLVFWKIAMHRAVSDVEHGEQILGDFHKPFAGLSGSWAFMRVLRWGRPSEVLRDVPGFLPGLLIPTLIFHGAQDIAIPEEFSLRASELIPNSSLVTLESGHFIPLNQPGLVAVGLAGFFHRHTPIHGNVVCV